MRILHVCEHGALARGGAVAVARGLTRELASRGHDVEFWTSAHGGIESLSGVHIRAFRGRNISNLLLTPGILIDARTVARSFDVVHLHNVRSLQNAIVSKVARWSGLPHIVSPHGSLTFNNVKVGAKRVFDALFKGTIIDRASCITATSNVEAQIFASLGISLESVQVVFNPVEVDLSGAVATGRVSEPVIGFLGRLERTKAVDKLIHAFRHAVRMEPGLRLAIAGPDEGDEARLRGLSVELGIDRSVTFLGALYGSEKARFLNTCAVIANPCAIEIFGLSVLEALAHRRAVVVAQGSGCAEIASMAGATAVVDSNQAQAFGEALVKQLQVPYEECVAASDYVKRNLSLGAYVDRVELVYQRLVS